MMKTTTETTSKPTSIPDKLYFRIGDVAELVGVKPYVLRYWETEFSVVAPQKTTTGQRVYRRSDVESLLMIKHLLYTERYSIEGAKRRIRELRKDGSLKKFKQSLVTLTPDTSEQAQKTVQEVLADETAPVNFVGEPAVGGSPGLKTDLFEQIEEGVAELRSLADAPIDELFSA